jgi:hypothetical protein
MENCTFCTSVEYFYKSCKKCDNDKVNKMREELLYKMLNNDNIKCCDKCKPQYLKLKENLKSKFNDIYNRRYDKIDVKPKGGRGCKCDFELTFYYQNKIKNIINLEFKYGTNKITGCPQFLNQPAKECTYHKHWYDTGLKELCKKYKINLIDYEIYEKYIFNNYKKNTTKNHEFFNTLYDMDIKGSEFKKEKDKLVKKSIKDYLEKYKIDYSYWENKFREQQNKVFLLCKNGKFYVDKFDEKELKLNKTYHIKNNNTIVLQTKTNSKIHMLLRWKNRIGVLLPAWQIKLVR